MLLIQHKQIQKHTANTHKHKQIQEHAAIQHKQIQKHAANTTQTNTETCC